MLRSFMIGESVSPTGASVRAIERVASVCRERGLIAASVAMDTANLAEQVSRGITCITVGADSLFMRQSAAAHLDQARKLVAAKAGS